ncbi:hypothetical protein BKA70DRAFT_1443279 [Coprinopsis sp. MPI-PUGE-AT-0042]|nr:hypothetical protein BKA70DRAFT_1443279 [Coprinopsis sp. MPI-PUGE-AT-0042]
MRGVISNLSGRASGLPSGAAYKVTDMMQPQGHVGSAQQRLGLPSISGHQGETKPISSHTPSTTFTTSLSTVSMERGRADLPSQDHVPSIYLVATNASDDSLVDGDGRKERGGYDSGSTRGCLWASRRLRRS